jgi:hypothetical protein
MIGVVESIAAPVTDEVSVHIRAEARFEPNDLTIAGARDHVASQGAVNAQAWTPLIVPASPFESRGFIRINAGRAEIDEVSRKRTFQRTIFVPTEICPVTDLHGTEVSVTGKFLIETAAPPAMDAAVHFMLDQNA